VKVDGNWALEGDRSMRGGGSRLQESEHADRPHTAIGTRDWATSPPNGKLLGTNETTVCYIAQSERVSLNVLAAIVRSLPNLKRGLIDAVSWICSVPQTISEKRAMSKGHRFGAYAAVGLRAIEKIKSGMCEAPLSEREMRAAGVVQMPGSALRLAIDVPASAQQRWAAWRDDFVRQADCLPVEALESVACSRVHDFDARSVDWLLALHDRVGHAELSITCRFHCLDAGRAAHLCHARYREIGATWCDRHDDMVGTDAYCS
jgi:hypothetical protein